MHPFEIESEDGTDVIEANDCIGTHTFKMTESETKGAYVNRMVSFTVPPQLIECVILCESDRFGFAMLLNLTAMLEVVWFLPAL